MNFKHKICSCVHECCFQTENFYVDCSKNTQTSCLIFRTYPPFRLNELRIVMNYIGDTDDNGVDSDDNKGDDDTVNGTHYSMVQ